MRKCGMRKEFGINSAFRIPHSALVEWRLDGTHLPRQ
jgi:hypothetical protein